MATKLVLLLACFSALAAANYYGPCSNPCPSGGCQTGCVDAYNPGCNKCQQLPGYNIQPFPNNLDVSNLGRLGSALNPLFGSLYTAQFQGGQLTQPIVDPVYAGLYNPSAGSVAGLNTFAGSSGFANGAFQNPAIGSFGLPLNSVQSPIYGQPLDAAAAFGTSSFSIGSQGQPLDAAAVFGTPTYSIGSQGQPLDATFTSQSISGIGSPIYDTSSLTNAQYASAGFPTGQLINGLTYTLPVTLPLQQKSVRLAQAPDAAKENASG